MEDFSLFTQWQENNTIQRLYDNNYFLWQGQKEQIFLIVIVKEISEAFILSFWIVGISLLDHI